MPTLADALSAAIIAITQGNTELADWLEAHPDALDDFEEGEGEGGAPAEGESFRAAFADHGNLVLKEVKSGVHRWVSPEGTEHETHPATGEHADDAALPLAEEIADHPQLKGILAKINERILAFALSHPTLTKWGDRALALADAAVTSAGDVKRNPSLMGKFAVHGDASGDAVAHSLGIPASVLAKVAAFALVKGWNALKKAIGKQMAEGSDDVADVAEVIAGLLEVVYAELGLGEVNREAVREWVASLEG